jgi:hypothetical protein
MLLKKSLVMAAKPELIEPLTKFGKLTFIEELDRVKIKGTTIRMAMVQCDCGKFKSIRLNSLLMGKAFTCGENGCNLWGKFKQKNKNPYTVETTKEVEQKQKAFERSDLIKRELIKLKGLEAQALKGKVSIHYLMLETRNFLRL